MSGTTENAPAAATPDTARTAAGGGSTATDAGGAAGSPANRPSNHPSNGRQGIRLVRTAAELRATAREYGAVSAAAAPDARATGSDGAATARRRAVVMTMGALHAGHAALVRTARESVGPHGQVVVTVFVNPLQFGPSEDLDRYPRTLDADLVMAEEAGADVVFAPSVAEVYPETAGPGATRGPASGSGHRNGSGTGSGDRTSGPQVRIAAGPMGDRFEGAHRPGHFDGVLTVVAKLLHLTAPDIALYGQKDAQQLALIRRMVTDLNFPVEIVAVPTVRESDGMALSSRNRYLSPEERQTGLALSRALFAARDALPDGGADVALAAARTVLDEAEHREPPLHVDYLALIDPSDFTDLTEFPGRTEAGGRTEGTGRTEAGGRTEVTGRTGEAVLAVAGRVGGTRLIDNIPLPLGALR
ncbi:pantoate--beta-alanine ligase [Streptomyces sp. HNM0575]|uniref:pantoate--beta-alanine ligase n=1 Tax=Streptomyces sp. HNM0575 TaxID=2716338 RepID=UPI00145EC531|nr:pantoate--beta-alanine ligase [Streptomyces sp. HNM0575]NLU75441.1 pantoate--beta-alanine ligase [Streptomyces sp. HNM0575]